MHQLRNIITKIMEHRRGQNFRCGERVGGGRVDSEVCCNFEVWRRPIKRGGVRGVRIFLVSFVFCFEKIVYFSACTGRMSSP